ncbi:DUF1302 domain-containing protein [Stenotrophobium rhamnosiphilum]|uniref:DUF1302 domain-containing protein n=1 Tax=Stenotrophobium rhamnosiphilum TaxID=2029166 RepID=A0A2T5MBD7_9GAMM|nr:DUF1302 family protein [Stenotrophobium rhamnosiphilum]PTU29065.1 hypothetical protein CJD38_17040 [Stenotrophobium rhamnosiphilum]
MTRFALTRIVWLAAAMVSVSAQAQDLKYEIGELQMGFTASVTSGIAIRTQDRNLNLIGKLNVPGQQNLCTADDCMSLSGDPAPNLRLVNAKGSYSGGNTDNGNLNYDKYDIVQASTRLTPTLAFSYGDWSGRVRGILFYDPVNDGFEETHPNTRFQPAHTKRPDGVSGRFARGGQLRDAYISNVLHVADRDVTITFGNQRLTWGESFLTPLNTLNTLGPPDAVLARMPGFELRELYRAVPALSIATEIVDGLSADVFYQWRWNPANAEPVGSFFSTNDFIGGGHYITLGLGQYAEDPDRKFRPAGISGQISHSSRTIELLSENYGRPKNGGQYGIQLKYYADSLFGGTELGAYYANYHSRLPHISVISANASCTRQGQAGSFVSALAVCQGFKINPNGLEPVPTDSMKAFLDYPEDIHMLGLSFSSNLGPFSLSGEYAYRPNMPLQVHATDVIYAGLAPAFPEEDINIPADLSILGLDSPFTIPGHRHIAPDFLSVYRGMGTTGYGPNQVIRGYERFKVGQFSLLGIHVFGPNDNYIGADQLQFLLEVSGTQIFGLPELSELQLEGTGNRSHYSEGADGTGSPTGQVDSLHINPTQQKDGAATSFSYGYRVALKGQYSRAIGDISLYPTILWFHDLGGISPATIDNYVAGRQQLSAQLDAEITQSIGAGMQYQIFTGGGRNNQRSDRDNLGMYVRYSF